MSKPQAADRLRIVAFCPGCTLRAVRYVYEHHPWFRLIRGPYWLGMVVLSWWHGYAADDYIVRNTTCYGCVRFRKEVLVDRSPLFRFLSRWTAKPMLWLLRRLSADIPKFPGGFSADSMYQSFAEAMADLERETQSGTSSRFARPLWPKGPPPADGAADSSQERPPSALL